MTTEKAKKRSRRSWRKNARILTDKEWARRCAIGAGVLRGRLARKLTVQIMACIVVNGDCDGTGNADAGKIQETIKRVLIEEGY